MPTATADSRLHLPAMSPARGESFLPISCDWEGCGKLFATAARSGLFGALRRSATRIADSAAGMARISGNLYHLYILCGISHIGRCAPRMLLPDFARHSDLRQFTPP
jgi:hypothetical protein